MGKGVDGSDAAPRMATVAYTWEARHRHAVGSQGEWKWFRAGAPSGGRQARIENGYDTRVWTVIGTGVVDLIAVATSNRQLRCEMKAFHEEIRGELSQVHGEIGRLHERMAKLEGFLEGLREAITGRKST